MGLTEAKKLLKQQTLPCHWGKRNKVLNKLGILQEINMFLWSPISPDARREYETAAAVLYKQG